MGLEPKERFEYSLGQLTLLFFLLKQTSCSPFVVLLLVLRWYMQKTLQRSSENLVFDTTLSVTNIV